jgi:hypothetical protein
MSERDKVPGFPPDGWALQGQRLDGEGITADYVRDTSIHIARKCVGLKPFEPRYYDALYPWDIDYHRKSMAAKQSKCALNVLMILRALGFELPEDGKALAWRFGRCPDGVKPPEDPITQLQRLPGWRAWQHLPEPGDAMMIGRQGDNVSVHAMVVVGYEDSGHTLVSVDGGSGAVRLARREIVQLGSDLCVRDPAMGIRPIIGTIDVAAMRGLVVREYCEPV